MRIILISQYFFPETGATSNRVFSLAKKFQEEGHDVRVIAEKPNHPKGIFFKGFERGIFLNKKYKGIPITYTWVYTRPEKGFLGRILFYVSFMFMAVVASLRLKGEYDVVLASSPPLFVGVSGWAIAKLKSARFVFDVRDLWPEVAVKMGELNNRMAIRLAESVEHFLYRNADLITAVTTSFKKTISDKKIASDKIKVFTNGTDPEVFHSEISKDVLREKLGIGDGFIIAYVGNIGLAQGLDHIIECAEKLEQKGIGDINFIIVGEGPKKEDLIRLSEVKKVQNLSFVDRVPLEEAAEYMNASDALLVPLANDPIYSQFIPSKLFDSMAASRPVLLSVDGESREILDEAGAGIYYEAEDADQLLNNILWLKDHKEGRNQMGKRGREYVVKHYSRDAQAKKMLETFHQLLD